MNLRKELKTGSSLTFLEHNTQREANLEYKKCLKTLLENDSKLCVLKISLGNRFMGKKKILLKTVYL